MFILGSLYKVLRSIGWEDKEFGGLIGRILKATHWVSVVFEAAYLEAAVVAVAMLVGIGDC